MRQNHAWRIAIIMLTGLALCGCQMQAEFVEEQDFALSAAGIGLIDASTANGSITVVGTDGDQVLVHAVKTVRAYRMITAEEFAQSVKVEAVREDGKIRIWREFKRRPRGINVSVRYEIQAPRTIALRLGTSNGAISADGITAPIDARTSNGRIGVQGGREEITLQTSNGRIELEDTDGKIDARTSNGRIDFAGHADEISLRTSNGAITARVGRLLGGGSFITSNGAIDLCLPESHNGQISATTSNGKMICEFPITEGKIEKNAAHGQLGEGGPSTIGLRTQNGRIALKRL